MKKTNKIVVLAHAQSRFTTVEQKLNAVETFTELKNQLLDLGLKCSKETLVSDTDSCKRMLMLIGIYAKKLFKTDLLYLEKGKSIMVFNLGNEIKNAVEKNPLVLAVHNFKTTNVLRELKVSNFEDEPTKEQILIIDMNKKEVVFLSKKVA